MPRLLRSSLPVVFGVTLLLQWAPIPAATASDDGPGQVVSSINAARASGGEAPRALDPALSAVAQWWSGRLAAAGAVSHNPDLLNMAPAGWEVVGENAGRGATVGDVEAAFGTSAEHLANMTSHTFAAVGVGIARAGSTLYVVEDFGGTSPTRTASALPAMFRAVAAMPGGSGYWVASADGSVWAFGEASALGSLGGRPNQPVAAMAATPSGHGYWLVASDGGVFTFGDAPFLGSLGGLHLNQPVVAMAATPSGHGYWLVASDGGVFTFGDAVYDGSGAARPLGAPVEAVATAPDGYWMLSAAGTVASFGGAPPLGAPAD
jgi:hypothetical protein